MREHDTTYFMLNLVHGSDRKLIVTRCEPKLTYTASLTSGFMNIYLYGHCCWFIYLQVSSQECCFSYVLFGHAGIFPTRLLKAARNIALVVNTRSRSVCECDWYIGELKAQRIISFGCERVWFVIFYVRE